MSKSDDEKAKYQRQVFDLFANVAQLDIADGPVVQGKPPAPDIVCMVDGQQRAFELTALADPAIERKVLGSKRKPSLGGYSNHRITIADTRPGGNGSTRCNTHDGRNQACAPKTPSIVADRYPTRGRSFRSRVIPRPRQTQMLRDHQSMTDLPTGAAIRHNNTSKVRTSWSLCANTRRRLAALPPRR